MLVYGLFLLNFINIPPTFAQTNMRVIDALSPVKASDGLQVSDINSAGLNKQKIIELTKDIIAGEFLNIHSVLIAKHNTLIYEYYSLIADQTIDTARNKTHPINSITKSVVSLLLGIALKDEFQANLTRPLSDYLPSADLVASRTGAITLDNILTMSAGYLWNEMEVPYTSMLNDDIALQHSKEPLNYVLSRQITTAPGSQWYYNGGLTMLVAALVKQLTKARIDEFAAEMLFKPLSIEPYIWAGTYNSDLINAAWGLRLTARDLVKIGMLVLNKGRWYTKQIVPDQWIALSTQRIREDLGSWSANGLYGYGYHWWHGRHKHPDKSLDVITALGAGGQRVFVLPEEGLVVTIFAANYGSDWLKPEAILNRIVDAQKR